MSDFVEVLTVINPIMQVICTMYWFYTSYKCHKVLKEIQIINRERELAQFFSQGIINKDVAEAMGKH
jgi:hypothetical protein